LVADQDHPTDVEKQDGIHMTDAQSGLQRSMVPRLALPLPDRTVRKQADGHEVVGDSRYAVVAEAAIEPVVPILITARLITLNRL
jgi:hypothetical protein